MMGVERYKGWTTTELKARRVALERLIEDKSGRLTPNDSDFLDDYLDQRDAVDEVLKIRQAL